MKLAFIYQPVHDMAAALAFYRDQLGFTEAWREGESTVAFELPGSQVQLMLDVPPDDHPRWGPGAIFQVDDVDVFVKEHSELRWLGDTNDIPGGREASFTDPGGNVLHLLDQSKA